MQHIRATGIRLVVVLAALTLLPTAPLQAAGQSAGRDGDPDWLVVRVHRDHDPAAALSGVDGALDHPVMDDVWRVRVPRGTAPAALDRLRRDPRVVWAEPDATVEVTDIPNDPCFDPPATSSCGTDQWGLRKVGAPAAWDVTHGSSGVTVAVLDTGVQAGHPDLSGKVTVGTNYSTEPVNTDGHGHGTHVIGIVAAATGNTAGVAGLGWATTVRSIKVLDDDGAGLMTAVALGIQEAISNGVEVINMSFVTPESNNLLHDAVDDALDAGIVVVGAAGNFTNPGTGPDQTPSNTTLHYPAAYDGVISVAATDRNDNLPSWSIRGSWVSIAAPGADIVSTWPTGLAPDGDGYARVGGTSMAAPHVAAAAALLVAAFPGITVDQVRARLGATAARIPGTGTNFQWGRLDVIAALRPLDPGYRMVASDGGIFTFGSAAFLGSMGGTRLSRPIVGMAASPTKRGYWLVGSDGAVYAFGDARALGGLANAALNAAVLGIEPHPSGSGYWLVASDGGIFSFGDAAFHGSTGNIRLNQPVVGMTASATGKGYWMVARDGGIFSFGDAAFHGSTGALRLNQPVVGMAATPSGKGYWLVASDGGIFAFGDARFHGSTGALRLNQPIVGMRPTPTGNGYWMVARDGGIFAFGDAAFLGSMGGTPLNQPIVGMAA